MCSPPSQFFPSVFNKYITSSETCRKDIAREWDIYQRCQYIKCYFASSILYLLSQNCWVKNVYDRSVGCKIYIMEHARYEYDRAKLGNCGEIFVQVLKGMIISRVPNMNI
jgi:hypothetical protein